MDVRALADVNGLVTPLGEARISVLDRGFLFGDAVYEVIRIFEGAPFHLESHLDRLQTSAEGLQFANFPKGTVLRDRAYRLLEESGVHEGSLYFQVTRGQTDSRNLFPDDSVACTVVVTIEPRKANPEKLYETGVRVVTRPEERWLRADLKTVNLIPRILARRQAKEAGAWEILWTSRTGEVLEGGATNVFAVIDGILVTPPLGERILAGITRQYVLEIAEARGVPVTVRPLSLNDCLEAEECFLTGTTTEVLGVSHINDQAIGSGKPGPTTIHFRGFLRDRMSALAQAFHQKKAK